MTTMTKALPNLLQKPNKPLAVLTFSVACLLCCDISICSWRRACRTAATVGYMLKGLIISQQATESRLTILNFVPTSLFQFSIPLNLQPCNGILRDKLHSNSSSISLNENKMPVALQKYVKRSLNSMQTWLLQVAIFVMDNKTKL